MTTSLTFLPSNFGAPVQTTNVRYDTKGRQLSYAETEVQRLERLAFISAPRSRSGLPPQSASSSSTSSPTRMRLIAEPYGDPIELMANRLAENFAFSSDDEPYIIYSSPNPTQSPSPMSPRKSPCISTCQPGHRKKQFLNAIPEED